MLELELRPATATSFQHGHSQFHSGILDECSLADDSRISQQQMPPGAPGGQPVQLTPEQLQQHQMQMAMALEQQKQMNLDRALTLPSLDDEVSQCLLSCTRSAALARADRELLELNYTREAHLKLLFQPFQALPIGINREDHQLTLVSETAAADTTRLVNAFEPALHPTPEQAVAKVNLLAELFKAAPDGAIPPPPQNIDRNRSGAVNKYKEDGNVRSAPCISLTLWKSRVS